MGFVYEEVGEENRELWESIGWKDWVKNPIDFCSIVHWAIDRENKVYMQPIGSFIDTPEYYDLAYKGRIVRMEILEHGDGTRSKGFNILWDVHRICIPQSIWEYKSEILKAVFESFKVCRGVIPEDKVKSISVEINCTPECMEEDYNGR